MNDWRDRVAERERAILAVHAQGHVDWQPRETEYVEEHDEQAHCCHREHINDLFSMYLELRNDMDNQWKALARLTDQLTEAGRLSVYTRLESIPYIVGHDE